MCAPTDQPGLGNLVIEILDDHLLNRAQFLLVEISDEEAIIDERVPGKQLSDPRVGVVSSRSETVRRVAEPRVEVVLYQVVFTETPGDRCDRSTVCCRYPQVGLDKHRRCKAESFRLERCQVPLWSSEGIARAEQHIVDAGSAIFIALVDVQPTEATHRCMQLGWHFVALAYDVPAWKELPILGEDALREQDDGLFGRTMVDVAARFSTNR